MDFGLTSTLLKVAEGNTSSSPQRLVAKEPEGSTGGDHENTLSPLKKTGGRKTRGPYRGARLRDGKWVSEIRIPKTKKRIWLGSHDSAEKAAQAYDDASYYIHGAEGPFNFPKNRSPQLTNQDIGTKSAAEIKRAVQGLASVGATKVRAVKRSSKSSTSLSLNKPVMPDSTDLDEMAAHKVNFEPFVTTNVLEVEPYVPELNFTTNASEMEPYIPTFAPEEKPVPFENLPFDEEFIKGSDDWILNFMAEPSNNQRN